MIDVVNTRLRLAAILLAAPLLLLACLGQAISDAPTTSSLTPSAPIRGAASPPEGPGVSGICPDRSWPPFGGLGPVAGISVRAIDKLHFTISNATSRIYYYRVSAWVLSRLDCGLGFVEQEYLRGPIHAGETIDVGEGSTPDVPVTVGIWDQPCGEACTGAPIGLIVVPVSPIDHVPMGT